MNVIRNILAIIGLLAVIAAVLVGPLGWADLVEDRAGCVRIGGG